MKKAGRKYPDHLADSCKRSKHKSDGCRFEAVLVQWIFLLSATFQTYCPNLTSLAGSKTWCPSDLWYLRCKALINKNKWISSGAATQICLNCCY